MLRCKKGGLAGTFHEFAIKCEATMCRTMQCIVADILIVLASQSVHATIGTIASHFTVEFVHNIVNISTIFVHKFNDVVETWEFVHRSQLTKTGVGISNTRTI